MANFWAESILGQGSSGVARAAPPPRSGYSEWLLQDGGRSPPLVSSANGSSNGNTDGMYGAQMFTGAGSSGAASPAPYAADQYSTHGVAQYTTRATGPFSSDPYYREYFAGETVATAAYQRPLYDTDPSAERYARPSYHTKGVIAAAAGLTVDLPSPDSGIGADAVTPRDQPAAHQVSGLMSSFGRFDMLAGDFREIVLILVSKNIVTVKKISQ